MNQEKIGALIASLRKQLGLTQSELGAKVGVGDRAVSKWERGITCPDISIINELSSILGITSDELLSGELNEEHKQSKNTNKFNKKYLILIPILLIITVVSIILINNNKTYVYNLESASDDYSIFGKISFNNDNTQTIYINQIIFRNKELNETIIKNCEYILTSNDILILRNGYINEDNLSIKPASLEQFIESLSINYKGSIKVDKRLIIKNGLVLKFSFLDNDNNIFYNEILISIK